MWRCGNDVLTVDCILRVLEWVDKPGGRTTQIKTPELSGNVKLTLSPEVLSARNSGLRSESWQIETGQWQ